jgi:hypothetical protein
MRQGKLKGSPPCPDCGAILDAFTGVGNTAMMKAGDYSFCAYCAAPLEWTGHSYTRLTADALVLARLQRDFRIGELVARHSRKTLKPP